MTDHLEQAAALGVEYAYGLTNHSEVQSVSPTAIRAAQHLAYLAGLIRGGAERHEGEAGTRWGAAVPNPDVVQVLSHADRAQDSHATQLRRQLWQALGRPDGVGLDVELVDAVQDAIGARDRFGVQADGLLGFWLQIERLVNTEGTVPEATVDAVRKLVLAQPLT